MHRCPHCLVICPDLDSLRRHEHAHTGLPPPHPCTKCGTVAFVLEKDLVNHTKRCRGKQLPASLLGAKSQPKSLSPQTKAKLKALFSEKDDDADKILIGFNGVDAVWAPQCRRCRQSFPSPQMYKLHKLVKHSKYRAPHVLYSSVASTPAPKSPKPYLSPAASEREHQLSPTHDATSVHSIPPYSPPSFDFSPSDRHVLSPKQRSEVASPTPTEKKAELEAAAHSRNFSSAGWRPVVAEVTATSRTGSPVHASKSMRPFSLQHPTVTKSILPPVAQSPYESYAPDIQFRPFLGETPNVDFEGSILRDDILQLENYLANSIMCSYCLEFTIRPATICVHCGAQLDAAML